MTRWLQAARRSETGAPTKPTEPTKPPAVGANLLAALGHDGPIGARASPDKTPLASDKTSRVGGSVGTAATPNARGNLMDAQDNTASEGGFVGSVGFVGGIETQEAPSAPDLADLLDAAEERAALMEFDGGLSRAEAEARTLAAVVDLDVARRLRARWEGRT